MMGGILRSLPELPAARFERYQRAARPRRPTTRARSIAERALADYFDAAVTAHPGERSGRTIANWMLTELLGALNADGKAIARVADAARDAVRARRARSRTARSAARSARRSSRRATAPARRRRAIVERRGVQQISDEALLWEIVDARRRPRTPSRPTSYASGKDGLFGFFVGQVMKETQGRANPVMTSDLLRKRLGR